MQLQPSPRAPCRGKDGGLTHQSHHQYTRHNRLRDTRGSPAQTFRAGPDMAARESERESPSAPRNHSALDLTWPRLRERWRAPGGCDRCTRQFTASTRRFPARDRRRWRTSAGHVCPTRGAARHCECVRAGAPKGAYPGRCARALRGAGSMRERERPITRCGGEWSGKMPSKDERFPMRDMVRRLSCPPVSTPP